MEAESTCNVTKRSHLGQLLQRTALVIFDEVTMSNRLLMDAIDRTLRDVRDDRRMFGGVTVIFSGDWRQIAPIVAKRATRADISNKTLKRAPWWHLVQHFTLSRNMRAERFGPETAAFSDFLLQVGDGRLPAHPNTFDSGEDWVQLPEHLLLRPEEGETPLEAMIRFVFAGMLDVGDSGVYNYRVPSFMCTRAIIGESGCLVHLFIIFRNYCFFSWHNSAHQQGGADYQQRGHRETLSNDGSLRAAEF